MSSAVVSFVRYHWHLWLGIGVGLVAGGVAHALGLKASEAWLVGWVAGSIAFLIPHGAMLLYSSEASARRRACREDENRAVLLGLMLGAVGVSFAAVFIALRDGSQGHKSASTWLVLLAFATIALSWLVVQSLFAVHYAHRYFGDPDGDGESDQGFSFTGEPPSSYREFVYVAICMGATCQVSDFNCTTSRMRNLVTGHAILAFGFNTVILALGINIVASLLGGGQ